MMANQKEVPMDVTRASFQPLSATSCAILWEVLGNQEYVRLAIGIKKDVAGSLAALVISCPT
jgi:hypothetical protein